ncbi:hypothetical protein BpHYR1_032470 [Brachionus plicatilis]|uniref:Uncharacterized protein n=1 Tax=Brachionus plicatilis TaxID=10195 RepID=A0A3M7TAG9_BRAPC|nr:hypothetical protein BpHYR1_032470 [Brachionus plicatilis]
MEQWHENRVDYVEAVHHAQKVVIVGAKATTRDKNISGLIAVYSKIIALRSLNANMSNNFLDADNEKIKENSMILMSLFKLSL